MYIIIKTTIQKNYTIFCTIWSSENLQRIGHFQKIYKYEIKIQNNTSRACEHRRSYMKEIRRK